MVLPKEFIIHEKRLSKEALESIKFQYDRLGLDSTDYKTFVNRFLRVSKSPTLPPDDYEIDYLANKVAYMLSDYQYYDDQDFANNEPEKAGAKIWYAMAISTQGKVNQAITILESITKQAQEQHDHLLYIESLAFRALFYHMHGSQEADQKDKSLARIQTFAEDNHNRDYFDLLFMPAYVITYRIESLKRPPKENIKVLETIYEKAQKISDPYWKVQIILELVTTFLQSNDLQSAQKYLDTAFEIFDIVRFPILYARAVCIRGNLLEKKQKYSQAEKDYTSSKELFQKLGDLRGVSTAVLQLAELTLKQNQNEKAERYFNESYKIAKQMTDYSGMTAALTALAKIALMNNQFSDSLATYTKALDMATEHNFYQYLPAIYDGLAVNNFIAGDFWMSIKNRNHSVNFKEKFDYPDDELLLDHMKLGELNALVGNLQTSFSEFEQALNLCMELGKKDEIYFDILIWLFEISTSLEEFTLADSYIGRAELFASIHNSEEENVQALISRTRFLIQKNKLEEATKILEVVFEKAQDFPSPLTMALALIEKGMILLLQFIKEHDSEVSTALVQTIENMVFISLDLEFLPLTMFAKKALAKVYLYENNMTEAIEEIQEAVEFAQTLGMISFEVSLREEIDEIKEKYNKLPEEEFNEIKEELLEKAREDLKQTFWLVNASEHQRIDN